MNNEIPSAKSAHAPDDAYRPGVVLPEDAIGPVYVAGPDRRRFDWERFGGKFLVLSIVAHLVFFAVAAYFIVQTVQAARKLTFASGPKGPSAPSRALEHKVQMKKQKSALSAPPQAKRVTTTGIAKVALPDMPAMPSMSAALSPGAISGMGSAGIAPGGMGGVMGGMGGSGGGAINFFGARTGGVGLTGTFYDLKQDRVRRPSTVSTAAYPSVISQFIKGGFNEAIFSNFFKSEKPLYTTQIYIPRIDADEGPKAFNLQDVVQPKMWAVLYKGRVVAPESGTFRFVGTGDDVLIVRFDKKIVLDGSIDPYVTSMPNTKYVYEYMTNIGNWYQARGHRIGEKITVLAGTSHSIEVLIGEHPGVEFQASLLIEKEGAEYKKDAVGNPILPIFRTSGQKTPMPAGDKGPIFDPDGPIWRTEADDKPKSFFDQVR